MCRPLYCTLAAALLVLSSHVAAEPASGPDGTPDHTPPETERENTASHPDADPRAAVIEEPDRDGAMRLDGPEDLTGLDEEVDLLFADFDIVVTASRADQSAALTPVPVSVLDADDIHYSGVREIQELLAFVPGVDAVRVGRNQWAIGVRGLHTGSSDRTLLLLNGRNASNALFGGFDIQRLPVFLPDIERVEVVRGPAGGAWGANAFNGVINIIEKSPRDTTGLLLMQRFNEYGDSKTNFRFGDADADFAWRLSAEIEEYESTGAAITSSAGPDLRSIDSGRTRKIALDGLYGREGGSLLDFGAAYTHIERGSTPFLGERIDRDDRIDLFRAHAKLSLGEDSGPRGYLQWHTTIQDVNTQSNWAYTTFDNAFEGQVDFSVAPGHETSVGGTLRLINGQTRRENPRQFVADDVFAEQWVGVFASNRWSFAERWTLETQGRFDWYSETHIDWAGRVALVHQLDDDGHHALRIAGAKAFRTPQKSVRDIEGATTPIAPGPPPLFLVNVVDPGDLDNEQIYSAEVGYTGRLAEGLTLTLDAYYQVYEDLTGTAILEEPAPQVGRFFFTLDNVGGARAYGGEVSVRYENESGELGVWYAYNDLELDDNNMNVRAFLPADHKAGVTGRLHVTEELTLNANYNYYAGATDENTPGGRVPLQHRLDLAATLALGDGTLRLGVIDLFDETGRGLAPVSSPFLNVPSPGRTFFVEFAVEF